MTRAKEIIQAVAQQKVEKLRNKAEEIRIKGSVDPVADVPLPMNAFTEIGMLHYDRILSTYESVGNKPEAFARLCEEIADLLEAEIKK